MSNVFVISGDGEFGVTSPEGLITRVKEAENICAEFNRQTELRRHNSPEFYKFLQANMVP